MEVHSLTVLHYGADYLPYAIQSVYNQVDVCHVFYTPNPSHGHSTNIPPVETRAELQRAAYQYDPDNKVKWYDTEGLRHEGQQRDLALQTVINAGAELVLVLDYDEIWPDELLGKLLSDTWSRRGARNNLVNMIHLWRSFNWACKDQGWPVRIIDTRLSAGLCYLRPGVFHFGYAITDMVMRYKWKIHGHKNEMRPGWLDNIWPQWPPPADCHPTNDKGFWNPEPFDKEQLPEFMKAHPFYNLDKIE